MMNTAEIHVGRLLEIRVADGYRSVADVDALFAAIAAAIQGKFCEQFVLVADWRSCTLMSSEAAQRALERMTRNNRFIERSAILSSPRSPTAVLQFLRVVRESNHEKRRLFQEISALVQWVAEVLTPEELARLGRFLGPELRSRSLPPR